MKISIAIIAFLLSSSAMADFFPQSFECQSDPVEVNGQNIIVKANLETGYMNSFKSLEYSYQTAEGEFSWSSKNGLKCTTTGSNIDPWAERGEITQCDPGADSKFIGRIGIHFVMGLGFTTKESNVFNLIKCEYKK